MYQELRSAASSCATYNRQTYSSFLTPMLCITVRRSELLRQKAGELWWWLY